MDKWYELGIQLDRSTSDLNIIRSNNANDVIRAKIELFEEWTKNDPEASWKKLSDGLKKIGHGKLSTDIYTEYGMLLTLAHALEGYSSLPVCLSVCHALSLEITYN